MCWLYNKSELFYVCFNTNCSMSFDIDQGFLVHRRDTNCLADAMTTGSRQIVKALILRWYDVS